MIGSKIIAMKSKFLQKVICKGAKLPQELPRLLYQFSLIYQFR